MRPIIPCHSAYQNNCAKFVSKALKPVIALYPSIIQGTRHLAKTFKALPRLDPNRRWYIVTGDITAYYPNIDRAEALRRTIRLHSAYHTDEHPDGTAYRRAFNTALMIANKRLIFDFENDSYEQIRGIAMGVACSPDIANIYGLISEIENTGWLGVTTGIPQPDHVAYYGRYIDDVISIVAAESSAAAIEIVAGIAKYPGCEVTFDCTEHSCAFLDMWLMLDHTTGRIEHKPYRKAYNHLERLPWISGHPKDIKRGVFLGEMSRLATLCSDVRYYIEAIKESGTLYVQRGYPVDLVNRWIKDNLKVRWDNRLGVEAQRARIAVQVLKTQFNPIWQGFDVHKLETLVKGEWNEAILNHEVPFITFQRQVLNPWTGRYHRPARLVDLSKYDESGQQVPTQTAPSETESLAQVQRTLLGETLEVWTAPAAQFYGGQRPVEASSSTGPNFQWRMPSREGPGAVPTGEQVAAGVRMEWYRALLPTLPPDLYPTISLNADRTMAITDFEFVAPGSKLIDRKWLVSRKRTTNLSDLSFQWRKEVLKASRLVPPDLFSDVEREYLGDDTVEEIIRAASHVNDDVRPDNEMAGGGVTSLGSQPIPNPNPNRTLTLTQTNLESWLGKKRPRDY